MLKPKNRMDFRRCQAADLNPGFFGRIFEDGPNYGGILLRCDRGAVCVTNPSALYWDEDSLAYIEVEKIGEPMQMTYEPPQCDGRAYSSTVVSDWLSAHGWKEVGSGVWEKNRWRYCGIIGEMKLHGPNPFTLAVPGIVDVAGLENFQEEYSI